MKSWDVRTRLKNILKSTPRWLNASIDAVFDWGIEPVTEWIACRIFLLRPSMVEGPAVFAEGNAQSRILIAPMNYSGQGSAWARSISSMIDDADASNLAIRFGGPLQFTASYAVPYRTYLYGMLWQRTESRRASKEFTHILVEAEEPIFRMGYYNSLRAERRFFQSKGLSVAYVCHGSDIRSPGRHKSITPLSPFFDNDLYVHRIQRKVDRNRRLLEQSGAPVFVSTPDLIDEVRDGVWLPVVVDVDTWTKTRSVDAVDMEPMVPPLVLHTPSKSSVKGSHLIGDAMARLVDCGTVRYREVSGVSPTQVIEEVRKADIVLDQFRIGSYGVAACEAMAAGRVVIGHVTQNVRDFVLAETGHELPIVEATPDTLEAVLSKLVADHQRIRDLGRAGVAFTTAVHDGRMSAAVLEEHWLRPGSGGAGTRDSSA